MKAPLVSRSPFPHPDDALKHLAVDTLKPWPGNARTHSKKQVRQIADSITTTFDSPTQR